MEIRELEQYIACPYAYFLSKTKEGQKEEKKLCVSIAKSIIAKKAIQAIWKEKGIEVKQLVSNLFLEYKDSIEDFEEKHSKTMCKGQKAMEQVTEWITNYSLLESDNKIVDLNYVCQASIMDVSLNTVIDKIRIIEMLGGEKECVIFSTSSSPPSVEYLKRSIKFNLIAYHFYKQNEQIRMINYYLPYLEQLKRKSTNGNKGELKGIPNQFEIEIDKKSLINFEWWLAEIIMMINKKIFPKMPRRVGGCEVCRYKKIC